MCGIAGLWDQRAETPTQDLAATARTMADSMRHRGPDDGGVWCDAKTGIAFGHRRLSIVDLSPNGAQPMASSCGRYVLSYNGEVYNADLLRPELEAAGRRFRGHSDTEVMVEGFAVWGVEATLRRLIGMFAFSAWDREERRLYLARDRLGIKPLYWAQFGPLFLFASELKGMRAHEGWRPALDRDSLAAYLRVNCIAAPRTIYQDVKKLAPGMLLAARAGEAPELRPFWTLEDAARAGQAARFTGTEAEATDRLEALLGDAVRRRMVADVPLGAFLSGGIDSSTVVALMQANSTRPVRTFSIGFHERAFDEAAEAARVARHLGTDHTELYVSPEHARAVIPRLPEIYDEPFADASQIPTFLVSELTRKHVTVALSGDGGDEVFAGYTRYFEAAALIRMVERLPRVFPRLAAAMIRLISPDNWSRLGTVAPGRWRPRLLGDKLHKLANVLDSGNADDFYRLVVSHWNEPETVALGSSEPKSAIWDARLKTLVPDFVERMQYLDTMTYLPDDILTKVDRASMAVSLEARVPLIDHRVVEFSWSLPPALKADGGAGKRLLRQVLYRFVPRQLVERPKMGFGVPIDSWMRGPLRDWAENLLDERRLRAEGIFDPRPIRLRWREHLAGTRNWQYPLWDILMFQAWKEHWLA